jgi:hypothetical protein
MSSFACGPHPRACVQALWQPAHCRHHATHAGRPTLSAAL